MQYKEYAVYVHWFIIRPHKLVSHPWAGCGNKPPGGPLILRLTIDHISPRVPLVAKIPDDIIGCYQLRFFCVYCTGLLTHFCKIFFSIKSMHFLKNSSYTSLFINRAVELF